MTRDIEFRAWDKINKSWCNYTNADCMNNLNNSKVAITQFTGVRDKNGKKIFEGDILLDSYYRDNGYKDWKVESKGYVRLLQGAYCLVCIKDNKATHDALYRILNPSDSKAIATLEIIGNIFENKNILIS